MQNPSEIPIQELMFEQAAGQETNNSLKVNSLIQNFASKKYKNLKKEDQKDKKKGKVPIC